MTDRLVSVTAVCPGPIPTPATTRGLVGLSSDRDRQKKKDVPPPPPDELMTVLAGAARTVSRVATRIRRRAGTDLHPGEGAPGCRWWRLRTHGWLTPAGIATCCSTSRATASWSPHPTSSAGSRHRTSSWLPGCARRWTDCPGSAWAWPRTSPSTISGAGLAGHGFGASAAVYAAGPGHPRSHGPGARRCRRCRLPVAVDARGLCCRVCRRRPSDGHRRGSDARHQRRQPAAAGARWLGR